MTKKTAKQFQVGAQIAIHSTLEINADSLEDALEKAKSLKISDFVEVTASHDDSHFVIHGVSKSGWLPELS